MTKPSPRDRAERRRSTAEAETRRDYRSAGMDYDPRTAAGRRELTIGDLGHTRRARAASYGTLIRNTTERTATRVQAMRLFDQLCHEAHAGLLPEPRFLPRVDESATKPGRPDNRADALREMQRLTARVGEEAHALLIHRVFLRMKFTRMAEDGHGEERARSVLFVAAVDAVARFYGLEGQSAAVEAANRLLGDTGLPEPCGLVHGDAHGPDCASRRAEPPHTSSAA